jgi:pimeloyl-ACP methyl ester carboxylesterase
LREHQPPTLVLWGKDDQYYTPEAARAYLHELPAAEVHVLDGGHWVVESHPGQVAELTRSFLARL